jgi:hypothetical protein
MGSRAKLSTVLAVVFSTAPVGGQQLPPLRPLGPVVWVSPPVLQSVGAVRALPRGRVLVNDIVARRLLLFDSTLSHFAVVLDSAGGTGHSYGTLAGGLIAFSGDSTLFVDRSSLSMLLMDGDAKIVRVLSTPRVNDVLNLVGGPYGTPALDARGRLVYRGEVRRLPRLPVSDVAGMTQLTPDSAPLVRFDFGSRILDTLLFFRTPALKVIEVRQKDGSQSGMMVLDPLPNVDDWVVVPDGSVFVLRGRDYHLDRLDGFGRLQSMQKTPFVWERLTDDDKIRLLDSAKVAAEKLLGSRAGAQNPLPITLVRPDEMPDFRPPFAQGALHADVDGNIWIRTTQRVGPSAIYDVVNQRGALIYRVMVPPFRMIAGFGADGSVYLSVRDSAAVRLERARAR